MNQKGVTFLETLVVVALIAIILLITIPYTLRSVRRARAEAEIRNIYSNIVEARQRALERNFTYFVEITGTVVNVYQDSNANGTADPSEKLAPLSLDQLDEGHSQYSLNGNVTTVIAGTPTTVAINSTAQTIAINNRGMIGSSALIYLNNANTDPALTDALPNCVSVITTRIGQGKYDGTNCKVQ
jgi:prepilin-type N-terminal cleavage/methylation domain-containing protein